MSSRRDTALPDWVRDIVACPQCKGALTDVEQGLRCENCAVNYPVRDGVVDLLMSPGEV